MTRSEANSEVSEGTQSSYGVPIDLLKNTPSNIARLEDVIDQCKGRQKYLAQTRSPSDGEDVRWYFCKVPLAENALAASVPRTEVVGKGEYFRFAMRDSLALEASFLQREEELLSVWWKEYGECSEGPTGSKNSDKTLDLQQEPCSSEGDQTTQLSVDEEERVGVPVKGGLYEVDLAKRHCFPVYWNGENRRVLRGHWFARKASLDWLPLREDVAEQLEFAYRRQVWHRRTFQPSGLFAARVDMQGSMLGLHALFTGEDDTWEAWLNIDASGLSNVFNIRGNGIKLRRGYSPSGSAKPTQDELRQQKEEEMDDYCSQVPVGHLVFMVHGIGQRLEKANLVDDVGNFRQITASLAERHLSSYQRDTQRVLFIPCQWRRGLKLGGESTVEKITLNGVKGLRVMLSATAHDILYYMSPIYCQEIINSVSNQLNRLYKKFLKRNPGYDGKVSIYAHSLGSVLSYDILCHQYDLSSPFPMDCVYKDHVKEEQNQLDQCSECKSFSTKDEYQEPLPQKETTNDQDVIAPESPASKLQEASSRIYPENVSDVCQQNLESKQFTEPVYEEDTREQDSSDMLSLEQNQPELPSNKNNGVCSSESDSQQENTTDSANHTPESIQSADLLFEEDIQEQASTNMLSLEENDMELSAENTGICSCELNRQQDNAADSAKHSLESKQSTNLLLEEDVQERASSNMLSLEENDVDLGAENNGVSSCEIDRLQRNSSNNTSDNEKLIKLLMEEVDSLKARIADLESRTDDEDSTRENHQDDKEVGDDTPKEGISEKTLEQVNLDKTYTPRIKYTKLDFKVDTFFAVGSPLGVFLALRNVRMGIGRGKDYWEDDTIIEEMPACRQMFNIFHPFDPVAYRVDPLVCKEYTDKRPVIIPWHRGGKRIHIGFQEFKEDLSLRSRAMVQRINTVTVKVVTACQSRNDDNTDDGTEGCSEIEERSYGSIMMERLTGDKEGHIDHVLQDKTFEHQYISAIGSHTNYWRDNDTALFILKHLYRDIPEEPHSPLQDEEESSSSLISKPKFFQSDTVDDQLPLTFSDRMIAREFSRKVRKAMKKNM